MKVLMLGGTGAIGGYLVDLFLRKKKHIYVTTRKKRVSNEFLHYIEGNAKNIDFIQSLFDEKWDVIIDFMVYTTAEFEERLELLLNSTSQYVFFSSSRVFAASQSPINENSPRLLEVSEDKEYLKTEDYALVKARQEDLLKNSKRKNWSIIRPYITFSAYRLQLGVLEKEEWLYRALRGRSIIVSEDIHNKLVTLTYGADVAFYIDSLLGNEKSFGETFNITSSQCYTWEYILNIYLNVLERHLKYRPKVVLQGMETFLSWKNAAYQIKYDRLYNRKFDNSKIVNFSAESKFSVLEDSIEESLSLFFKKPSFKSIKWVQEAIKDKSIGERTSIFEIAGFKEKILYLLYRNFNVTKLKKWKNIILMRQMLK